MAAAPDLLKRSFQFKTNRDADPNREPGIPLPGREPMNRLDRRDR